MNLGSEVCEVGKKELRFQRIEGWQGQKTSLFVVELLRATKTVGQHSIKARQHRSAET